MNIKDYQLKSLRTMNTNISINEQITNMVFGMNGEIGEVTDILKKHIFHNHNLDRNELIKELGDVMFYIVNLATLYNIDMEYVLECNYNKLLKRYPFGFNSEDSKNRRVENE